MLRKKLFRILKNRQGFTLIEIIAVLVVLGILAAVAIPKYMNLADDARAKAAQGQIAEVKGRLSQALASYMLNNNGSVPATAVLLISTANALKTDACPTTATTEGDFEFLCSGATKIVTITVNKVQGTALSPAVSGTFDFTSS